MWRPRYLSLLCVLAAFAACRDSTSGETSVPATLDVVSGNQQEGTVGAELPAPLSVRVLDANGRPVAGQLVVFRVIEGGGSVFAGAALTDRSGIASERWTLGTSTSGSQRVEARAVESGTGNPLLFGVFQATAKAGLAVALERIASEMVDQVVGSTVTQPPSVRALDQYGNPVPGVAVTFAASPGGTVTGGSVTTGAAGVATVGGWTLATVPGTNTLTATAAGLPAVSFTINGTVAAAAQLTKGSIDPQIAPVATNVLVPPSITVLDAYGNPVSGVAVTFAITGGAGTVSGANQTSNDLGIATVGSWTLGTIALANTLEARAAGNAVVFTATGTPGPPSRLTKLAGDNQTAEVGHAVPIAPKVRVADQYDNAVAGAELTFAIASGSGTVTPRTVLSTADGSASPASWVLGPGANTLSVATGTAPPVTFTATAAPGPGVFLRVASEPSFAFSDADLGVAIQVSDASGNPVPQAGVTVAAAIESGPAAAALTGATATTDAAGAANFNALRILGPEGLYSLRFTASGMAGVTSRSITLIRFVTVSPGQSHTCALDTSGIPYCWGDNQNAQLGDGSISFDLQLRPRVVVGNHRFTVLRAGALHTCGLTAAGTVYCWGENAQGQLGDGTTIRPVTPVAVGGGLQFVDISSGGNFTCGLTAAGAAYCWGWNPYGQLGDGTTTTRTLPTPVAGNLAFTSISAGLRHTCGLLADGTAYCWGEDDGGALGSPITETCVAPNSGPAGCSRTPKAVTGGLRFASISAGAVSTCALETGGIAYCWGRNRFGEIGDGTKIARTSPTRVSTTERFVRLSNNGQRSCGLTANGTALCWGVSSGGGLGDGTETDRVVPTLVVGGHSFVFIAAPSTVPGATCGITAAGRPLCWGSNRFGQVGDGSTTMRLSPVPVKPPE